MTPEEKAGDLVGKMCGNNCTEKNINKKKKLAIIAVDEIIEEIFKDMYYSKKRIKYLEEVKKEIKKL